jgi:hypothetical protein
MQLNYFRNILFHSSNQICLNNPHLLANQTNLNDIKRLRLVLQDESAMEQLFYKINDRLIDRSSEINFNELKNILLDLHPSNQFLLDNLQNIHSIQMVFQGKTFFFDSHHAISFVAVPNNIHDSVSIQNLNCIVRTIDTLPENINLLNMTKQEKLNSLTQLKSNILDTLSNDYDLNVFSIGFNNVRENIMILQELSPRIEAQEADLLISSLNQIDLAYLLTNLF